jgi:hypothetical protein
MLSGPASDRSEPCRCWDDEAAHAKREAVRRALPLGSVRASHSCRCPRQTSASGAGREDRSGSANPACRSRMIVP